MARGAQPYSSIVILCNIGGATSAPYNGDRDGDKQAGRGGAAGPWRERPLRSPTCRVLRDLNLSRVGTGLSSGRDVCLGWAGLAGWAGSGQLERVRSRTVEEGGVADPRRLAETGRLVAATPEAPR